MTDGLDWPQASPACRVLAPYMDLEFYMIAGAFGAAIVVFALGFAHQCRRGHRIAPPPLPSHDGPPSPHPVEMAVTLTSPPQVETPYAPPQSESLARRLGLSFNRVSCRIYKLIDLPLGLFLIGVYMLPLFFELFSKSEETGITIGYDALLGTIVMQGFMVALVIGMVVWRVNLINWLGLRWKGWYWIFLLAPVGVLATWTFALGLDGIGYHLWLKNEMGTDGQQEVVEAFSTTQDPALLALLCLTAVVVAPLSEEILFRGYLYPASKRAIGRVPAILFSSLIFAAIHHNAMALLPLCFLAILLALAYEVSGSIWAPIAIHFLFNAATVSFQLAARWGWITLPEV